MCVNTILQKNNVNTKSPSIVVSCQNLKKFP